MNSRESTQPRRSEQGERYKQCHGMQNRTSQINDLLGAMSETYEGVQG